MADEDQLLIGQIGGPWGIKGWVRVLSYSDPREQIFNHRTWNTRLGPLTLVEGRAQGKGLVARFDNINDRDAAETLKNQPVTVAKEALPALDEGEYYWFQLEKLQVTNTDGEVLGHVDHLLETGAHDVLVVRFDKGERLIPFVPGVTVTRVDLQGGTIEVDWQADY